MSSKRPERKRCVCMVAYTTYSLDTRVRREAETVARETDFEVYLLIPREGAAARAYEQGGVKIRELGLKQYQGKNMVRYLLSYLHFMFRISLRMVGFLVSGRLAVVHIHNMPNILVFTALLPRLLGKRVILDVHDTLPETFGAKFGDSKLLQSVLRLEEKVSTAFATDIICVNSMQKELLTGRGVPANKIVICLNVPDPRLFANRKGGPDESQRAKDGVFRIIYHGTLAKRLGIDIAIDAVAGMAAGCPDVQFHIYGCGDDKEEFAERIRRAGATGSIFIHGAVPIDELIPVIPRMDLGVVSNRRSAATEIMLPVKMMEYVILGVPVVAPRLKTIQYYFGEDMVEFYEPGDTEDLREKMTRLCRDPGRRRMKAENAMRFIREYGWDVQKNNLLTLYRPYSHTS